jgi:hypothetical protein
LNIKDDIATSTPISIKETETTEEKGRTITKSIIESEAGIVMPTITVMNENEPHSNILILNGNNKAEEFEKGGLAWDLSQYAVRVALSDLRGIGETEDDKNHHGWVFQVGPDWPEYFYAYLLGESIVGMRVKDILSLANHLNNAQHKIPLHLIATGEAVVTALHAAALAPELFESIEIIGGIPSWEEVVQTPRARDQLINSVHGVLAQYDLPDLIELIGRENVKITSPAIQEF